MGADQTPDPTAWSDDQLDNLLDRLAERAAERDDLDLPGSGPTRRTVLATLLGAGGLGLGATQLGATQLGAAASWGSATGSVGTDNQPLNEVNAQNGHFQSVEAAEIENIVLATPGDDLQAKIDDAGVNGAVLVSGSITVTASVTPKNFQTILGVSEGATLKLPDNSLNNVFDGSYHHVHIGDLTIDMNASGGASGRAINSVDCYQVTLSNIRVEDGSAAAIVYDGGPQTVPSSGGDYGEGVTIIDCSFEGITSTCIDFKTDLEYSAVVDCEFQDSFRAIRIDGANHRLTDNKITYCDEGILVLQSVSNEGKHLISDNQLNHILNEASIKLVDVSAVSVVDNYIFVAKKECIDMAGAVNCQVRSNMTKCSGTGYNAILIRDASNSARGNKVFDNFDRSTTDASNAIREDNRVSGNHFAGNKASVLSDPWSLNSTDVSNHVPTVTFDLRSVSGSEIGETLIHDGSGRMPEVRCRWEGSSWRPLESVSFLYGGTGSTGRKLVSAFKFEQAVVQSGDGAVADAYVGTDISNGSLSGSTFIGELTVESTGGITVGDSGSDSDPNTDGERYNVFAT